LNLTSLRSRLMGIPARKSPPGQTQAGEVAPPPGGEGA
jgi:hypothetical protein